MEHLGTNMYEFPGNVPVIDQIRSEIKHFSELKDIFSKTHLRNFPNTLEEALDLINSFQEDLETRYRASILHFIKYKDMVSKEDKGTYYHLMGKMSNLFEAHAHEALPYFEKAAKFIPSDTDVWNDLGDCYLSLGNLASANDCFNEALRRGTTSWSYRSMSVVCRKEAYTDGADSIACVNMGVKYAKEAIRVNPSDSYSWMILGNAYMAKLLASRDEQFIPTQALQAYAQAEKNKGKFPELYFNKAIALVYAEEYTKSLEAFECAIRRDPVWKHAWEKYYTVSDYITKISDFCFSKGKVKLRKITQYILALNRETSSIVSTKYSYTNVSDLSNGVNQGKIVLGKVLWSCEIDVSFPFTFGLVDALSNLVVVTIYNLNTGNGVKIGDTIAIPNPNYAYNNCTIRGKVFKLVKIRVDTPKDITVNGKCLPDCHMGQSLTITKCE